MFGWQLDFHHQLDSKAAILYLGNGQVIDLKTQTPMVQNVLEFEDDLPVAITSNGLNVIYVGTNSAVYEIDLQQGKVNTSSQCRAAIQVVYNNILERFSIYQV